MFFLPLIVFLSSCGSTPSICEKLKLDNCNNSKRPLSRSASASSPSVSSAAFTNPAAISMTRGLGIETIHYDGYAQVGVITGTGRVGAAISNFPSEGTFFGNTAVESVQDYRTRMIKEKRFEENKLVFSTGINLFGGSKKKGLQGDLGLMLRQHKDLNESYGGGGLVLSYNKIVHLGFSTYRDVYYRDTRNEIVYWYDELGEGTYYWLTSDDYYEYKETFQVTSVVMGLKFSKFAFDYIRFQTIFDDETKTTENATVMNMSYFHKYWIFTYGRRFEENAKEVYEDDAFIEEREKSATFLGVQYAAKKYFLFGAFINYYLLNELSLGMTLFF